MAWCSSMSPWPVSYILVISFIPIIPSPVPHSCNVCVCMCVAVPLPSRVFSSPISFICMLCKLPAVAWLYTGCKTLACALPSSILYLCLLLACVLCICNSVYMPSYLQRNTILSDWVKVRGPYHRSGVPPLQTVRHPF